MKENGIFKQFKCKFAINNSTGIIIFKFKVYKHVTVFPFKIIAIKH